MSTRIWILGAPDPEMQAIESLLRACGEPAVYATFGERRVSGGEAYRADALAMPGDAVVYLVECSVTMVGGSSIVNIDHHRPGDPGFGAPPEEFLCASSIGQVWSVLVGLDLISGSPTPGGETCMVAAADHCLGAAYAGRCPGIDPDRLMRWRAASRARYQGRTVDSLLADVAAAKSMIEGRAATDRIWLDPCQCVDAQCDCCDGPTAVDMRGIHVPELPEAGTRYGVPYVADGLPGPDGRVKIVCSGLAEGAVLVEYMPLNAEKPPA